MLQELGFHKSAKFLPFPELHAGKFSPDKLEQIADKLWDISSKHSKKARGQLTYVNVGGKHKDAVIKIELPKTMDKADKYREMGSVMDNARFLRLGIK